MTDPNEQVRPARAHRRRRHLTWLIGAVGAGVVAVIVVGVIVDPFGWRSTHRPKAHVDASDLPVAAAGSGTASGGSPTGAGQGAAGAAGGSAGGTTAKGAGANGASTPTTVIPLPV